MTPTAKRVGSRAGRWVLAALVGLASGCSEDAPAPARDSTADVRWSPTDTLTDHEIESGRLDESWRAGIGIRPARIHTLALDTIAVPEVWTDIGPSTRASVDSVIPRLPLHGDVEGPTVLRVQALLDRARFSPGVLDGRWGKNTEKAVYWFQRRAALDATGVLDSTTYAALVDAVGDTATTRWTLSEDDLAGPFTPVPADVYRAARLPCLCYESRAEKLAERFHTTPGVLSELNPAVDFEAIAAGDTIVVPAVITRQVEGHEPRGNAGSDGISGKWETAETIDHVVISGRGFYVHAVDREGRILYHFPTTLGSRYDPSPEGILEVVSIHSNPWFHYQPRLLSGVDRSKPSTHLPPGPNNLVGDTWIKLSKPHYGIHGTRDPETIGYATSSGCVRLTNWDARFLRQRITVGTRVVFEDTTLPGDPFPDASDPP